MSPTTDPDNDFAFAPAAVQPAPTQSPAVTTITDAPPSLPVPPPEADPITRGNTARERARQRLGELVWEFPDGSRRVPLLTSSRWCLYESLRGRIGGDESQRVLTLGQATHEAYARRFTDAGILLYLSLHPASEWEQSRSVTVGERRIDLEPLAANFGDFLAAIRRWVDDAITINRLPDAVTLAEELASLTFQAVAISRPDPDDIADDGAAEKNAVPPWHERYISTVCRRLTLTRDMARNELPLFDGLAQLHLDRLESGQEMTWPEVEREEVAAIRSEIRAAFDE